MELNLKLDKRFRMHIKEYRKNNDVKGMSVGEVNKKAKETYKKVKKAEPSHVMPDGAIHSGAKHTKDSKVIKPAPKKPNFKVVKKLPEKPKANQQPDFFDKRPNPKELVKLSKPKKAVKVTVLTPPKKKKPNFKVVKKLEPKKKKI